MKQDRRLRTVKIGENCPPKAVGVFNLKDIFKKLESDSFDDFSDQLYGFAKLYASYLNLDFEIDILPHLKSGKWWEPTYGVKVRKGKEIGMDILDAFKCLIDINRTYQLAQGIKETVKYLKTTKKRLVGIDAGTGTGILSILLIAAGVDKVYAIEINTETYRSTKNFLEKLGLEDKIIIKNGDATRIVLEELEEKTADILVSENLATGLFSEPQYAIINHLSKFLSPDAQIIPYKAQSVVSLGYSDWDEVPDRTEIAKRRLKSSKRLTGHVFFSEVESKVGMPVPVINRQVSLLSTKYKELNSLFISTRFQINSFGKIYTIEADAAEFLGETHAFKIDESVSGQVGNISVHLKYEAGRSSKNMKVFAKGKTVFLLDSFLKA